MIQPNKDMRRRFEVLLAGPVSYAAPGGQRAVWPPRAAWSRQDLLKYSTGSDVSVAVKHEI